MRKSQVIGMILWRGGLLFAAAYAFFWGATYALGLLRIWGIRFPDSVKAGLGLMIAGFLLVMLSLLLERIRDLREEKGEET